MKTIKKWIFGLISFGLITFGAYKQSTNVLIIGLCSFAITLFLSSYLIKKIAFAFLKKELGDEVFKEVKNNVVEELKESAKISDEKLKPIYASSSTSGLAMATANIIRNENICSSCKKGELKEIPWEEKFNKFIEEKDLVGKPQIRKCDNCGVVLLQYDEV